LGVYNSLARNLTYRALNYTQHPNPISVFKSDYLTHLKPKLIEDHKNPKNPISIL